MLNHNQIAEVCREVISETAKTAKVETPLDLWAWDKEIYDFAQKHKKNETLDGEEIAILFRHVVSEKTSQCKRILESVGYTVLKNNK